MTTSARLLTILLPQLIFSLPLAACAAQPAAQVQVAQAAKPAQDVQAGGAAVTPSAAPAPSTAPSPAAQQSSADSVPAQSGAAATQPHRAAGTPATARSGGSSTTAPVAAAPAVEPATVPAPAANAPVLNPASPAAPETTVGGGAANRPAPAPTPVTMPASSATGSLLQTLFALIVVLGVLGALAWFLKRYGPKTMGGSANLRVVGSLNLGGRERLLVVEVGNQWIVVGASPGRVNALATMPKQEGVDTGDAHATLAQAEKSAAAPASSFADWLKQTIDKRK
jgi:flagellar biosynthetic protein FliO